MGGCLSLSALEAGHFGGGFGSDVAYPSRQLEERRYSKREERGNSGEPVSGVIYFIAERD
jgi:hypothetical protein